MARWKDELHEFLMKAAKASRAFFELNLEEVDYAQVLQHIGNFLPVRELGGRPLTLATLRQYGLVDNELA